MELKDYVRAGYPAIILTTPEEDRALNECKAISNSMGMEFLVWSMTKGFGAHQESLAKTSGTKDPIKVLEEGINHVKPGGRIVCLLDFHPSMKSPNVWRTAKDVFKDAKKYGVTYVFISSKFDVPPELEREVINTSLPLPTREEIEVFLEKIAKAWEKELPEDRNNIVEAAMGLTINEIENAFAVSVSKTSEFDPKLITQIQERIICHTGLLEYKSSKETLDSIGGLKNLTSWAMERLAAYSPEARAYGLPYPRGMLLVGIPGCGKSLTPKALANIWQKPLIRLDIGKLFGSLVGDTEANTRRALKMAEEMAPAILWIDEIEKGLSGIQSSGKTDSGVTSRLFGAILTWMQEKEAPVFVVATANNISELPPEFTRKGRFDEVFFVDLPYIDEREEIFQIQLKKYKREPKNFDVKKLAELTDYYTGAEIEESIVSAMFSAWNDGKREVTTEDIQKAIAQINPMATGMMSQQIEALRKWSESSAIRKANGVKSEEKEKKLMRLIRQ